MAAMAFAAAASLILASNGGSALASVPQPALPADISRFAERLIVAKVRSTPNDLPAYQLVDRASGAVLRVYYAPATQRLAEEHLAYLGWMITEVARRAEAEPGAVIWDEVVFTADPAYAPPRAGGQPRWSVLASAEGRLTDEGLQMLFQTLPHEQVHAVQRAYHARLPRWFSEGQASWIEQQVSRQIQPDLAAQGRQMLMDALRAATPPVNLSGWGSVIVRQEALLRQLSDEDRARLEADPAFSPSGPFTFGPDDYVSDESNTGARYGAALALFEELERQAGAQAMAAWHRAIWADEQAADTARIIELAKEHLEQDIEPRLR
jgi:hypothetical protein